MQLSIVIPALNERENIVELIPLLRRSMPPDIVRYEIIVVDGHSSDGTAQSAIELGADVITQSAPGYGGALQAGFERAQGQYILTLDADLSHSPDFLPALWEARHDAEVVVASRYVPGGKADMPWFRRMLSRILNTIFNQSLSLGVQDVSSGYRLYKAVVLRAMRLKSTQFDVLEEILIQAHSQGWRIIEIPFHYQARREGQSHVKLFKFGWAYLKTLYRMWILRNSIESADYDYRAYDSIVPLQRYWQRQRHKIITRFAQDADHVLDVGCGSTRILLDLDNVIGLDIKIGKVRYMRRYDVHGLTASAFALPFADESFDGLICSQVIEHIPYDPVLFNEMARLLKPGGRLILGTPDYGGLAWPLLEFFYGRLAPGGYADEHITHYTRSTLIEILDQHGFVCRETAWICRAELILLCIKS
ncbi:MAG: glycosyltransferase [Anaerolineales bacterium]